MDDNIQSGFRRTDDAGGILTWTVMGNEQSFRNFYVYTAGKEPAESPAAQPLVSARNLVVAPGEHLISPERYKYCDLEIRMTFAKPTTDDT
jgi:hypothetical protein